MLSTELTRRSPLAGYELPESQSLGVVLAMPAFRDKVVLWLLEELKSKGFTDISPSQLNFLGALDCGTNHAAQLAKDLNISRQAVHKIVVGLEAVDLLEMRADPDFGNRKVIRFTRDGERLMSETRKLFCKLDTLLEDTLGQEAWRVLQGLGDIKL